MFSPFPSHSSELADDLSPSLRTSRDIAEAAHGANALSTITVPVCEYAQSAVLDQLPIRIKPASSYRDRSLRSSQRVFIVDNTPGGAALRQYEDSMCAEVDICEDLLGMIADSVPITLQSGKLLSQQSLRGGAADASASSGGGSTSRSSPHGCSPRRSSHIQRNAASERMHSVLSTFVASPNLLMRCTA